MRVSIGTATVAGGVLAAWLVAGCGTHLRPQPTVAGCASYGVFAIDHQITVTRRPAACQGLSAAQVNQAVAQAIGEASGGLPKPARRKRAAQIAPRLAHLVTGPPRSIGAPPRTSWPGAGPATPGSAAGSALGGAALAGWLITAASGGYLLGRWFYAAGGRRLRTSRSGSPRPVVFGHIGLATAGLVLWVIYLAAGWSALAWIAAGLLLPVAGLGFATVTLGLPGAAENPRARPPVLIAAVHGVLAATTILLVLLTAANRGWTP